MVYVKGHLRLQMFVSLAAAMYDMGSCGPGFGRGLEVRCISCPETRTGLRVKAYGGNRVTKSLKWPI